MGHFGDNVLLKINNSKQLLRTDGTIDGTQLYDLEPYSAQSFQISKDTCVILSRITTGARIKIFTSNQPQPKIIDVNGFFFKQAKNNNHLLVLKEDKKIAFVNLISDEVTIKTYPEITNYAKWIVNAKNIILSPLDTNIHKISLDDFSISVAATTDLAYQTHLIAFNDSVFLYATEGFSDSTTLHAVNTITNTKQAIGTFPTIEEITNPGIIKGNAVYFAFNSFFTKYVVKSDGTETGTHILKELVTSPFSYQTDLIFLQDKLFFISNDTLWSSDGTSAGTQKAFDGKIVTPYFASTAKNGKFFFIAKDWTHTVFPYYHDGSNATKIYSEDLDKALFLPFYYISFEVLGKNHLYLPLVDINFGKELHRFDYETHEVEMVYDFSPGAASSIIRPLAETNNHLICYTYQDNKTIINSFDESQPITEPPLPHKNYDWQENLRTLTFHTKANGVADSKGNYYAPINTFYPKSAITLEYNRQVLDTFAYNKIIKFSPKGEYISSIQMPNNRDQPIPIAINSNDELITATILNTNTQISGQNFDPQNGNLLIFTFDTNNQIKWSKQFSIGLNGALDHIAVSKDNQIFIIGKYSGKMAQFEQHTVHSERNITTFLIKLSNTGEVKWAKNYPLPTIWPIDNKTCPIAVGQNTTYIIQRVKETQRIPECTGSRHRFKLIAIHQASGKTLWEKEFISPDFSTPIDIAVSPKGQISIIGAYMDQIQFDNILLTSDSYNQTNFFHIDLDTHGQILKAERMDTDYQFLTQVIYDDESKLYITGTQVDSTFFGEAFEIKTNWGNPFSHKVLTISKYNTVGSLIKKHQIHQYTNYLDYFNDWWDFEPTISFSTDQRIILSCVPYVNLDTFNITNSQETFVYGQRSLFFLQYKNEKHPQNFAGNLQNSEIFISPNPTQNYLNIQSTDIDFTNTTITIFSIDGRRWILPINQNHGRVKINTSSLPAATYIVTIQLGSKVLARKFVKI